MLMVMGLALMTTCQALVSMMVSVGIGPVTGQPLPMISRGGTSALITSIYFGIIMSVSREQTQRRAKQQAAMEESMEDVPTIELDEEK
jgi:cell division protein FtsW